MKFYIIRVFYSYLFAFLTTGIYAQDRGRNFYFETKYGQTIFFNDGGSCHPGFIKVNNDFVFETKQDPQGCYDSFRWAGELFSGGPINAEGNIQIVDYKGKKVCLRWVIEVGYKPQKHYIIDFTKPKPFVVGPFGDEYDPEMDIKQIKWGNKFATIEFASTNKYYYEYKTLNISFQEEP